MAATYGPLALTANTITSVGIPATSDRVYIGNDSPNDLLVSFAVSQPQAVTISNGDWPYVVQAMHHATLDIPDSYMAVTALGPGGFLGKVWVLPLPRKSTQALNGSISTTSNLWVTALDPGDDAPDAYAAPRQTDLTSQARVIAVPVGAQESPGSGTIASLAVNASVLFGSIVAVTPNAAVQCYLHWATFQMANSLNSYGALQLNVVELQQNGSTVNATYVLLKFIVNGPLSSAPVPQYSFFPAIPYAVQIQTAATTRYVALQMQTLASSASAAVSIDYHIGFAVDNFTRTLVPDVGGTDTVLPPGTVF